MKIKIPKKTNDNDEDEIEVEIKGSFMITGANGSGKTKLGWKIEKLNENAKRISAQRNLTFSPKADTQNHLELFGEHQKNNKTKSAIQPQNDFNQLLIELVVNRNEIIQKLGYKHKELHESKEDTNNIAYEKPHVENIINVWKDVFQNQKLTLKLEEETLKVNSNDQTFSSTELSDGEKVGFYLIAQVVLANEESLIIIDEPELHLHKALMVRLWNKLEKHRQDCRFIYITHDLDFASRKSIEKLIWVKEIQGDSFVWEYVETLKNIPQELYLEMLGSRTPIIFCEGENNSLDFQLYQPYYENFTIIPLGSCQKVIDTVKSLRTNEGLHRNEVFGIIDPDFRSTEELEKLKNDKVYSLELKQIENVFIVPKLLEFVANHNKNEDKEKKLSEFEEQIKECHKKNYDTIKSDFLKLQLRRIAKDEFSKIEKEIDINSFARRVKTKNSALKDTLKFPDKEADVKTILQFYNKKDITQSLIKQISFNTKEEYYNKVVSFLNDESKEEEKVREILKDYLPTIEIKQN